MSTISHQWGWMARDEEKQDETFESIDLALEECGRRIRGLFETREEEYADVYQLVFPLIEPSQDVVIRRDYVDEIGSVWPCTSYGHAVYTIGNMRNGRIYKFVASRMERLEAVTYIGRMVDGVWSEQRG